MAFQGDSIFWVEVEKIVPNPFQPRREFDEEKLKELAESVRMYGILQPLTVTRKEIQNEDGSFRSEYELIAGERRLRASKLAGVAQVPVIIREGEQSEQEKLELAIIENLQREDLNAVDRAIAFRQLADVFGLSHVQVAKKMGRSREYVSNSIRLLALPDYMLSALRTGDIAEGHARALLMLNDRPEEQDVVFRETLLKKLSVREVERISRGIATEKMRKRNEYDSDLLALERKFTETLGTRVSITKTDFGGRLSIDYFTQEELEAILEGMRREASKVTAVSAEGPKISSVTSSVAAGAIMVPPTIGLGNPRADELAILTNATGLEAVETAVPFAPVATPVAPAVPAAVTVPSPVDVASPTMPAGAETPVMPIIPLQTAESPASLPTMADQTTMPPAWSPQPVTVAPAEPLPVQPQSAPGVSVPEPTTSSLRDQLATLLGQTQTSTPHVVAEPRPSVQPAPVVTTPPQPHAFTPATVINPALAVSEHAPDVPPPAPKPVDDSDLYSIRDFSI